MRRRSALMRAMKVLLDPNSSSLWWAMSFVIWAAVISVRAALGHALIAALPSLVLLLACAAADVFVFWYSTWRWPAD